jgi:replicative DNA helicase
MTDASMRQLRLDHAERALVGALLSGYDQPEDLNPAAFLDGRCRDVVAEYLTFMAREMRYSPSGFHDQLHREGKYMALAGFMAECIASTLGLVDVEIEWPHVRDAANKRKLAESVRAVLAECGDMTTEDLVGALMECSSSANLAAKDSSMGVLDMLRMTAKDMQQASDGSEPAGVPTGLPELDNLLGRLNEGNVTILAGRPSQGKSSLARTIALNAAMGGYGVHYMSAEDTVSTFGKRIISDLGRIDLHRLASVTKGSLTRGDMDSITSAFEQVKRAKGGMLVDDSPRLSSAQIASRVRRHKAKNNTRLVVVDYIGLVREDIGKGATIGAVVTKAMHGLVELARRERVAVLALSQLNRQADADEEGRPRLAQLRDSGELEQCAYAVMLVHRPEHHNANCASEFKGKGCVQVAKNKNGPTGDVWLRWDGSTATYRPLSTRAA